MKLANLALQGSIVRCRHHLFAAARGGQTALRHQAAPREQLVRGSGGSGESDAPVAQSSPPLKAMDPPPPGIVFCRTKLRAYVPFPTIAALLPQPPSQNI